MPAYISGWGLPRRRIVRRRGSLSKEWTRYNVWVGKRRVHLDAKQGRGYVLIGWRRIDGTEVVAWSVSAYLRSRRMKKKKAAGSPAGQKHLAPVETTLLRDYMPLIEHCAMTQYEDGDQRKVGRITFTTFGGVWQAEVKDPDTLQQMRLTAQTVDELFVLLAIQLGSEDAPWEPDVWAQQQAKKNRK